MPLRAIIGSVSSPISNDAPSRQRTVDPARVTLFLLEPRGVRVERAQILLGFDNEAVLVLLGELSRGVIDVARFTYWAQQIADVFRKYVTRQTGKARRAPQQFDPTAQDVGKRRASMHPWAAGMLFSAPDARVE